MKKPRNELQAGVFILVCLILFAASIFVMGRERQLFSDQTEYTTRFSDVKGLSAGAPVRLGGITIGRVGEVSFPGTVGDSQIVVTLLVNEEYASRVRTDSTVSIETQGLLGDRFISLTAGTGQESPKAGTALPSREGGDINEVVERVRTIVDSTSSIVTNVNDAVTKFKSEGVDHLIQASQRIARITEQLESGSGIAHQLIYSGTFSNQLSTASEALATLLKEVQTGKGLLHTLFYGSEGSLPLSSLSQTVASLEETSKMIRSIVHEVQHGKGVLHHLVYGDGEASLDGLMQQLTETTSSLKVAADALAGGKGTLGALLIDPSLYDNLVEVTDDAKRSFLLREALKHSLKK